MHRRTDITTLVQRARAGDLDAFDRIVRHLQDSALAYALQWTGDPDEAEDAAQCAFVDAWRLLHTLREPGAFVSWFRSILRKQCDRLTRDRTRHASLDGAMHLTAERMSPAVEVETRELRLRVRRAVEALPHPLREVVLVRYFGGASVRQTAEFLGIPEGSVKRRLHEARARLRAGDLPMIDEFEHARPSRDDRFADQVRRLIRASAVGDSEQVRRLLTDDPALAHEAGPHPHWGGKPYALHTAVEHGQAEIVDALLTAGASPDPPSAQYDGWTPLLLAVAGGHERIVERLLAAGAPWDAWSAAAGGMADVLRRIIAANPSVVHERRTNDAPPLHFATTLETARLLVDAGTDLTLLDKYGSTATRAVSYSRRTDRAAGLFLRERSGEHDVFLATALGDHADIRARVAASREELERMDAHLDAASGRGSRPLHVAVAKGDIATATLLLDLGADPNGRADDGVTPLHYAARFGDAPMITLLLSRGADRTLREDTHRGTAADWADFFRQPGVLPLLGPVSA